MNFRIPFARWFRGRAPIPYFVLLVGLVATVSAAVYVADSARRKDEIRFQGAVEQLTAHIQTTADTYVALLRAGAGFFTGSVEVTLGEFRDFVGALDLRAHYPGIQGIGFARRTLPSELKTLTLKMEVEGMEQFSVWPTDPRQEYFPIVFLEPLDRRNRAAIGYDMFTEPMRQAAMARAARTGMASASGLVVLKQEIDVDKQAGFLIYMPVYREAAPLETESQRFAALQGFVYSPFRAGDFLRAALSTNTANEIRVAVYDGSSPSPDALLFDTAAGVSNSRRDSSAGRFHAGKSVEVAGRHWFLAVESGEGFEQSSDRRALPWILSVGVLVSVVLFRMTQREVRARSAAERAAAELIRSQDALRASVEAERQAHEEAESANRAKDQFLATLSHELRTPLNAILGWATMMRGGRLTAEQNDRAVDVILRNARTQAQLVEDLLDVSRIITGKLRVDIRPSTFAPQVRAALDAIQPTAEAKGVTIESHILADGHLLGDPDRLQQIAWNLLSNAVKFTPAGGRVIATLEERQRSVVFTVRDTGVGIDPEFLPFAFERFRQHDSSTTRSHGGMGLGLAIVRHLVEMQGGSVRAESEGPGAGSTLTVELPMQTESTSQQTARPTQGPAELL